LTIRRWQLDGGALALMQCGTPTPGPGEVVVAMKAAAINSRDLGILAGVYPNKTALVPLSDGAGIVAAVGAGVEGWAVGDAVAGCFYPYWESGAATADNHRASLGCEIDGVLAELALIPATGLVAKPASLSFAEAATLPCAALTAWTALFTEGGLLPGQHVLIEGTGGVACFAIQFARMAGAEITVISSDDAKLARARAMGADHGINYRTVPDWDGRVLAQTGGRGVDLVVELGGAETLPRATACVTVGGRICVIGVLSGLVAPLPVPNLLFRHIAIQGITVGHRQDFLAMNRAIDAAGIKPVIDSHIGFADAQAAFAALPGGRHIGKIVIDITD
jgi:NADPH:quinone reductase-like Zn-dependent oxidoreductase